MGMIYIQIALMVVLAIMGIWIIHYDYKITRANDQLIRILMGVLKGELHIINVEERENE